MKKLVVVIFILFASVFSYSQVNSSDSTNLILLRNSLGLDNAFGYQDYDSTPANNWYNTWWDNNGRLISFGGSTNLLDTGYISSVIGNLTELRNFNWFGFPNLIGEIPVELGNLTKLESISLQLTHLSKNLPPELGNIDSLMDFFITQPIPNATDFIRIDGTIPSTYKNWNKLRSFYLMGTNITGPFWGFFSDYDTLRWLTIENNPLFYSEIPDSICMSSSIENLILDHNAFYGPLPACIGNMQKLGILDVSHNNFTGAIPSSLYTPTSGGMDLIADSNQFISLPLIPSGSNIIIEDISNNKLQFGDFENNYFNGCWSCIWNISPQDSVWSIIDTSVQQSTMITLNSVVTGQYNTYQWFKNGVPIGNTTNGSWVINNVQYSDSGTYTCNITNQYITPSKSLILNRYPIHLHVNQNNEIDEINDCNIKVLPNPASTNIQVKINATISTPILLKIYDMHGILVKILRTNQNENIIDIIDLEQGVYTISVVGNNINDFVSFVKM